MKKSYDSEEFVPLFKTLLENGDSARFTVTGNSMYPLLSGGRDEVFVRKKSSYKRGDVVLYTRKSGNCVLHRIISVDKKNRVYTICGDNEMKLEHNVPFDCVLGYVYCFVRKGKEIKKSNLLYKIYSLLWINCLKSRKIVWKMIKKIYKILKNT